MQKNPAQAGVRSGARLKQGFGVAQSTPSSPSRRASREGSDISQEKGRQSSVAPSTPSSASRGCQKEASEASQQKRRQSSLPPLNASSTSRPASTKEGSETSQQKRRHAEAASSSSRGASQKKEIKPFRKSMDPRMLNRKLSFVDCTIGQIQSAIASEDPSYAFHAHFWHILLSESPPMEALPITNRTLTFWLTFYNKWQALGDWRPGYAPQRINGFQMQELVPMSEPKLLGIIKLFDPPGFKRIHYDGLTNPALEKVAVDVGAFMTAGVMLSQVISSKHKLVLILGIVDVNDNTALEEPEFEEFIRNFVFGLGSAFGILEEIEIFPPKKNIELIAKRLYSRISAASAGRLREMIATHDPGVIEAIRKGAQSKLGHPHRAPATASVSSPSSSCRRSEITKSASSTANMVHQSVPMSALYEWCHKNSADPLAVSYTLTIERFCPARKGNEMIDEFDDRLAEFSISHTSPFREPLPEEFHGHLLSRREVEQAHCIFDYCHEERSFNFFLEQLETELQIQVEQASQKKFKKALRVASEASTHINFCDFLRFLCPDARPKHLRMFDSWRQECIQIIQAKETLSEMEQLSNWFADESAKPTLPACEVHALEEEFKRIDTSGNGIIDPEELASAWGWSVEDTKVGIEKHAILADGCIDKEEFLQMMCPPDYRLPDASVSGRAALGKLLSVHTSSKQKSIEIRQTKFKGDTTVMQAPAGARPEVDEDLWDSWIKTYAELDRNSDGRVSLLELQHSGVFSKSHSCQILLEVIGEEESTTCFSRDAFLRAMLAVHGCRRSHFERESIVGA